MNDTPKQPDFSKMKPMELDSTSLTAGKYGVEFLYVHPNVWNVTAEQLTNPDNTTPVVMYTKSEGGAE